MTIIERDLDFYTGEVERHKESLRRDPPDAELDRIQLIGAAVAARDALEHYAKLLARRKLAQ